MAQGREVRIPLPLKRRALEQSGSSLGSYPEGPEVRIPDALFMKIRKAKYSEKFCHICKKWFYQISNSCPDAYMHEELGIKCCHWMDVPLPPAVSSHERKRRKKLEEKCELED